MEAAMLRVLVFLFALLTANVAVACDWSTEVCDFPSDGETYRQAAEMPRVATERRLLDNDRNEALEGRIERVTGIPIVCAARTYIVSNGENWNAALCAIRACLSLPPPTPMVFEFNLKASRALRAGEAVYLLTSPDRGDCATAHLDRFGWWGSY